MSVSVISLSKAGTDEDYAGFFQTAGYIEHKMTPMCDSGQYSICTEVPQESDLQADTEGYRRNLPEAMRGVRVEIIEAEACVNDIRPTCKPQISVRQQKFLGQRVFRGHDRKKRKNDCGLHQESTEEDFAKDQIPLEEFADPFTCERKK